MLAVRIGNKDEEQGEVDSFSIAAEGFPDFDDDTHLLDSINFDDLFVGINDGDVLPDLEMDHELLAQFSLNNSVSFEQFDDNSKSVNKDEGEEEGKAHGDQEIKYRSHRKHLLAREAEAASWSQRRQMYGAAAVNGGGKRELSSWGAPTTMGFPPMHPHFRPLNVWPKYLQHSPSPPPPPALSWPYAAAPPPPHDPSYWHHHHHQRVPNALTPGTPCFPHSLPTNTRFGGAMFSVIPPPHPPYKLDLITVGCSPPHPPLDSYPSKESIDSAIGDALAKPWLPLPLGLKPPSLDSVKVELQRQGIPRIPPSSA
ncbi:Transcription activator GLK1, partial [Cucurbita argyrosperma subsp. sororia]